MDFIFEKNKQKNHQLIHDTGPLNDQSVLALQQQIIKEWKNKKESFFLKYSSQGLSICAAIGGIYINSHYRTKLRLGSYGRVSSYLPIVALPAITTSLIHSVVVQPAFMLQKEACPLCTQIKGGFFHASLAVGYPMVLAPLASFMFASRHYTFRMPSMNAGGLKELFHMYMKMSKPILTPMTVAFFANFLFGMFVTYREMVDFHTIMTKVDKKIEIIDSQ